MAAIPDREHSTAAAVLQWWEQNQESGHRPHLGASLIGHACERHLWLTFRWALAHRWDGRMLRLFDDGKRAEARFVAELRGIGCEVWDMDAATGDQFRVSAHGGHFGGALDAVVLGLPEAPKTPHVAEFKTSNDKLFKVLQKDGVRKAKPQHFDQMQTYMGLMDLTRAVYIAENKNDASIYVERIEFDPDQFGRIMERALRVIAATEPPPRISTDPAWHECKWCNHYPVCHGDTLPEVNCRTCAHSTPMLEGEAAWRCDHRCVEIDLPAQRVGCNSHRYIPILLDRIATQRDATPEPDGNHAIWYELKDGKPFVNGKAHFSSAEIRSGARVPSILADSVVRDIKTAFPDAKLLETWPNDLDEATAQPEKKAERVKRDRIARSLDQLAKTSS